MKKNLFLMLLICIAFSFRSQAQWNIQGDGTAGSPYLITSGADLKALADTVNTGLQNFEGKYFKVTAAIDLSAYTTGEGWPSIGVATGAGGTAPAGFKGYFNGQNFPIKNLKMNRGAATGNSTLFVGLFGVIAKEGVVENVVIDSCVIIGRRLVGALTGTNNGTIRNCNSTGTITGQNYTGTAGQFVGGLIGQNTTMGSVYNSFSKANVTANNDYVGGLIGGSSGVAGTIISNCYASGNVTTGSNFAGGLIGSHGTAGTGTAPVINCYATGNISGKGSIGGLIGQNFRSIINCYASGKVIATADNCGGVIGKNNYAADSIFSCAAINDSVSGTAVTNRVVGINTAGKMLNNLALTSMGLMRNGASYTPVADSLNGVDGLSKSKTDLQTQSTYETELGWNFDSVWQMPETAGYPILQATILPVVFPFAGGNGTAANPFLIMTPTQLDSVRNYLTGYYFILGQDIDLAGYIGSGWEPIGTETKGFSGNFNGKGFSIKNLHINRQSNYQGLFGLISHGVIDSLGIENCNVSGNGFVGGLAGKNASQSIIRNCYVKGKIVGAGVNIGGLVGLNMAGSQLINCHTMVEVTGNTSGLTGYVGGLTGDNFSGTITNCYAIASVSSVGDHTGGLSGSNDGTVKGCFAEGKVMSTGNRVGGLIGTNEGFINNCYSSVEIHGRNMVGGIAGSNEGKSITQCYATGKIIATNQYVGGIVGQNFSGASITYCAAICDSLSGSGNVGRIIGVEAGTLGNNYAQSEMKISSNNGSTYTSPTDGLENNHNGGDKSLSELQTNATYATVMNWSFSDSTWVIWEENSFPYFAYQSAPVTVTQKSTDAPIGGTYRTVGNNPVQYIEIWDKNGYLGNATLSSGNWNFSLESIPIYDGTLYVITYEQNKAQSYSKMVVLEDYASGIKDLSATREEYVKIYPNPAKTLVSIESKKEIKKIETYNIMGQKIDDIQVSNAQQNIDVSSYKEGTYLFKIYFSNQLVVTKQILIIR